MCFRIASEKKFGIASDLGVCDSNRIAHRGCIARFGPLRFCQKPTPTYLVMPSNECPLQRRYLKLSLFPGDSRITTTFEDIILKHPQRARILRNQSRLNAWNFQFSLEIFNLAWKCHSFQSCLTETKKRGFLEGGFCKDACLSWLWRSGAKSTAGPNTPGYFLFPWAWHWTLQKPPLLKPPSFSWFLIAWKFQSRRAILNFFKIWALWVIVVV